MPIPDTARNTSAILLLFIAMNSAKDQPHDAYIWSCNIGGRTGDDRTGGELINVGKREILHIVVHIVTQIAGKAG